MAEYYNTNGQMRFPKIDSEYIEQRYAANDLGFSYLFADLFYNHLRYVKDVGKWYYYSDKGIFVADEKDSNKAHEYARELVERMRPYPQLKFHVDQLTSYGKRETMIKGARSVYPLELRDFDKNLYLLNTLNCTIDLRDIDNPLDHNPEHYITRQFQAEFVPRAVCHEFVDFINQITCEDADLAVYLQKILGYALIGHSEEHCLFIFYGPKTRNGKSTLLETLLYLFGNYSTNVQRDSIADGKRSGASASGDLARLSGIRYANIAELPESFIPNIGLLKQLTGTDTVTFRHLFKQEIQFQPQFKIFISTNHLPLINDISILDGRRIQIVPFDFHIPIGKENKLLKGLFREPTNASGILNWLLDGYKMYVMEGLRPMPKRVSDALDNYRQCADTVDMFLNNSEYVTVTPLEVRRTKTAKYYEVYKNFCAEFDIQPIGYRGFMKKLTDKGIKGHDRKIGHYIIGYMLNLYHYEPIFYVADDEEGFTIFDDN